VPLSTVYHRVADVLKRENELKKKKPYIDQLNAFYQSPFNLTSTTQALELPTPQTDSQSSSASTRLRVSVLQSEVKALTLRLQLQRDQLRRKSSKICNYEKIIKKLRENQFALMSEMEEVVTENLHLKENVKDLKDRTSELEKEVELNAARNEPIVTKHPNGHFSNEVKECVFQLLDRNVSTGQIAPVMRSVLKFGNVLSR
jgi:chromosome segregation ATPase